MAFTLFDLLIGAGKKVGIIRAGTATGGSSVSVKDTTLTQNTADGDFNNATVFILTAVAPTSSIDGQFKQVTSYAASSGEFVFSSLAADVTAGTLYAYTTPEFSNAMLIEMANDALRSLGPMVFVDKNIVTSAVQSEYSLSTSIKYAYPVRVDLQQTINSTATDNDWRMVTDWDYEPSSAGAAAKLVFQEDLPIGRKVRVWYEGAHHRITNSTAAIDERVYPELAILSLVDKLYEYRNSLNRGSVPFDVQRWNDAKTQLAQAKAEYKIARPNRRRKLLIVDTEAEDHLPQPYPYGPGP